MISYKLNHRLTAKRDFSKIFQLVSSKCLDSKLLKMQVQQPSIYHVQNKLDAVSLNFCSTKRNFSFDDNKSSTTSIGIETDEFENIKQLLRKCLDDAITDQNMHQGSLVSNSVIQQFCNAYSISSIELREKLLLYMSCHYGVEHSKVLGTCETLLNKSTVDVSLCFFILYNIGYNNQNFTCN